MLAQNSINNALAYSILHFTLFVLACIDTHHYNKEEIDSQAAKIAHNIITDMTERGALPTTTQKQPQHYAEQK